MFGLFNNTPQYAGDGQVSANSSSSGGALGFFSGLLTFSPTPKYATATKDAVGGVPVQGEVAASSEQLPVEPDCRVPLPIAIVIQRQEPCQGQ